MVYANRASVGNCAQEATVRPLEQSSRPRASSSEASPQKHYARHSAREGGREFTPTFLPFELTCYTAPCSHCKHARIPPHPLSLRRARIVWEFRLPRAKFIVGDSIHDAVGKNMSPLPLDIFAFLCDVFREVRRDRSPRVYGLPPSPGCGACVACEAAESAHFPGSEKLHVFCGRYATAVECVAWLLCRRAAFDHSLLTSAWLVFFSPLYVR